MLDILKIFQHITCAIWIKVYELRRKTCIKRNDWKNLQKKWNIASSCIYG